MRSLIICFLFILIFGGIFAQKGIEDYFSDTSTIASQKIIGDWVSKDSLKYKVIFKDNLHEVTFNLGEERQYHFIKNQSGKIPVRGVHMQWPPYYCYIREIAEHKIELTFFHLAKKDERLILIRGSKK